MKDHPDCSMDGLWLALARAGRDASEKMKSGAEWTRADKEAAERKIDEAFWQLSGPAQEAFSAMTPEQVKAAMDAWYDRLGEHLKFMEEGKDDED